MVIDVAHVGKCKCLHTGHANEDVQYTMGATVQTLLD